MIWLIVIGAVLLILLILIFSPVRVYFDFTDGKKDIILKYIFIKKALTGEKKERPEKVQNKKKSPKKAEKTEEKEESPKKKGGIIPKERSAKIDFVLSLIGAGGKALRSVLKRFSVTEIFIDFKISDPDAYECALKFGKMNIALYNGLRLAGSIFTLKKESINVRCVFNEEKSEYNARFCAKMRPAAAIWAGILFIFTFLVNNNRRKNKRKAESKKEKICTA